MARLRLLVSRLGVALLLGLIAVPGGPSLAGEPIKLAAEDISEKEAFEAAKELGTIEAWEAFLNNFPKGFRADLARAYVKQLGANGQSGEPPEPANSAPAATAAPGPFDIALAITANQPVCRAGQPCSYAVVATNQGGAPFTQKSVIAVSLTPGATGFSTGSSAWSCRALGGGAVCVSANANLAPGQSTTIPVTFTVRPRAAGSLRSCARISWGGSPGARSVRDVQLVLNQRGFDAGPADGRAGGKTAQAIRAFQARHGLAQTGEIDLALLFGLFTEQGQGDADPGNDQACVQTALAAPPAAAAKKPPANPKKKKSASRCGSGRVWLEGQCIARSQVASFCGPGYKRSGSKCVSRYPEQPARPSAGRCPPGMIWELGGCTEDD